MCAVCGLGVNLGHPVTPGYPPIIWARPSDLLNKICQFCYTDHVHGRVALAHRLLAIILGGAKSLPLSLRLATCVLVQTRMRL
jgi:hypothetical protein